MEMVGKYFDLKEKKSPKTQWSLNLEEVFLAIPGPESWEDISRLPNKEGVGERLQYPQDYVWQLLERSLNGEMDQLAETLGTLEKEIKKGYQYLYVQIPDLVKLVGEVEATKYAKYALATHANLTYHSAGETHQLFCKIAIDNTELLKRPLWMLAQTVDTPEIFELVMEEFPLKSSRKEPRKKCIFNSVLGDSDFEEGDPYENEREEVRHHYMVSLMLKGRLEDAPKQLDIILKGEDAEYFRLDSYDYELTDSQTGKLYGVVQKMLKQNPAFPFWDFAIETAPVYNDSESIAEIADAS